MEAETINTLSKYFSEIASSIDRKALIFSSGCISSISGMKIGVVGIDVPIGTMCDILVSENVSISAQVVGFKNKEYYLIASDETHGLKHGMKVIPNLSPTMVPIGNHLLGRVLDGMGTPIDNKGPLVASAGDKNYKAAAKLLNPISRRSITTPLDVGIRAINALLTVGKGQRLGIFSGSGVGKSVLLGMMTRFTQADVIVVGLIGERGREVKEFIENIIGSTNMKKTVVVAAPADVAPLLKTNGATLATTIAEYFRDNGHDVLLIVDSLTRYAQAQRQIGLAAGELPATKGFPPSVFTKILQLIERAGNGEHPNGTLTAFYTILIEGDDFNDPIGDHARSILDGHICLSRELANAGHYPAIDIERSISRVMPNIVSSSQTQLANTFKNIYSCYQQNKEFIQSGIYQPGSDKTIDLSILHKDAMFLFLKQAIDESTNLSDSIKILDGIFHQKDNL